ncbi:hypothetical protein ACP0HM_36095 [Escherichia coli]
MKETSQEVRPFNAAMERNGKVYLGTTNQKKSLSAVIGKFKGGSLRYGKKENGFGSPAKP